MSFDPVTPLPGVAGLRFLERTAERQEANFLSAPQIQRDMSAFRDRIGSVLTAEDLVQDRQLLRVALGAYGLDEELGKTAFLQKVLEEGTEAQGAFATRFIDPRYRAFAEGFGFGNALGPQTGEPGFVEGILSQYATRQYEIAVGKSEPNLRLALGFKREIAELAVSPNAADAAWFNLLGSQPMRAVIEGAFGLPTEFATLDIDRQREVLQDRAQTLLGSRSLGVFQDPGAVNEVVDRFLVRAQIEEGPSGTTAGAAALSLLQAGSAQNAGLQIGLILANASQA
ncbi:MAG: DUF1217 domain-containing protein [Pseudomonadota bacterium]